MALNVDGFVRITKEGKDVINSNYLDDYFLDSDYPTLKIHDYGSFSTSILGTATITHTLGYAPFAIVFSQYVEDDGFGGFTLSTEYYQHDWYVRGASYWNYGFTKIYSDALRVAMQSTYSDPRPGVMAGFYYIFIIEVT